jgi:hypothetical protein
MSEPSKVIFNNYTLSFTNRLNYQRFGTQQTITFVMQLFKGQWD